MPFHFVSPCVCPRRRADSRVLVGRRPFGRAEATVTPIRRRRPRWPRKVIWNPKEVCAVGPATFLGRGLDASATSAHSSRAECVARDGKSVEKIASERRIFARASLREKREQWRAF